MTAFESVREDFVQLWGAMGPFWGISPTTARVYSWLLSRAEPADMDEIMAGLDLSRGAVSMALKELRDWHLVVPEKAAGSRRLFFHPATDLEKVMRNIVLIRKHREWDPILENLQDWLPRLEEDPSEDAKVFRERLASLEALVGLMDSMIEAFLKGGLVGKVGLKLLIKAARAGEGPDVDKLGVEASGSGASPSTQTKKTQDKQREPSASRADLTLAPLEETP